MLIKIQWTINSNRSYKLGNISVFQLTAEKNIIVNIVNLDSIEYFEELFSMMEYHQSIGIVLNYNCAKASIIIQEVKIIFDFGIHTLLRYF